MAVYPRIVAQIDSIASNARSVIDLGASRGVSVTPVVKSVAGFVPVVREIVTAVNEHGGQMIADSNLRHVQAYRSLDCSVMFIREPMLSEIPDLVSLTECSLISELDTLQAIEDYCAAHSTNYNVILMAELGDLREGSDAEELCVLAATVERMKHVHLAGVGANLSCYGNILPSCVNMGDLVDKVHSVQNGIGRTLDIISGGNSSSLKMLEQGTLPAEVNNLRCGESIMLGRLPCYEEDIPTLKQGTVILEAEIVELKEKPSMPWGTSGNGDAFGEIPQFKDLGMRKRALLAVGRQSLYLDGLEPLDSGVQVLGGASDYMICDVTDSCQNYTVGSVVSFICDYAALASGFANASLVKAVSSSVR